MLLYDIHRTLGVRDGIVGDRGSNEVVTSIEERHILGDMAIHLRSIWTSFSLSSTALARAL